LVLFTPSMSNDLSRYQNKYGFCVFLFFFMACPLPSVMSPAFQKTEFCCTKELYQLPLGKCFYGSYFTLIYFHSVYLKCASCKLHLVGSFSDNIHLSVLQFFTLTVVTSVIVFRFAIFLFDASVSSTLFHCSIFRD
jgi:hypothetical protein